MPEFKGSVKYLNFVSPGFGAASEGITPQGNALTALPWKFGQSYASLQSATAAIRNMQALGAQFFHLQVVQDGEKQYYPNGTADLYEFEQDGAYVWHSFQFRTQLVTNIEPVN